MKIASKNLRRVTKDPHPGGLQRLVLLPPHLIHGLAEMLGT